MGIDATAQLLKKRDRITPTSDPSRTALIMPVERGDASRATSAVAISTPQPALRTRLTATPDSTAVIAASKRSPIRPTSWL